MTMNYYSVLLCIVFLVVVVSLPIQKCIQHIRKFKKETKDNKYIILLYK